MQVIVQGLVTTYDKVGTGPVVLLLHGWGDNLKTFGSLQSQLKSNFTVVSVDLPGFGGTEAPKETFNLDKYAKFVHDFMDKIGIDKVYALIGHSNGGAISIKAIASANIEPKKLVLLASSGIRSTFKARKKALRLAAKAAKLPVKLMPEHIQDKVKKAAYGAIGSEIFVAESLQETFKQVVGEDVLVPARNISTDTILIYGSEDKATLPAFGKLFADAIKNSKLHIIDGSGHFLHHTHANEVEKLVTGFLKAKGNK